MSGVSELVAASASRSGSLPLMDHCLVPDSAMTQGGWGLQDMLG